jgi:hypothetical protein
MQAKTVSVLASASAPCASSAEDSRLAARGACVSFWAAACWIVLGVESIVRPYQENYRDLVWMIPFALTVIALAYLHAVQSSALHRVERAGFYAVMVASALTLVGSVGVLANQALLARLGFPWGALLWTVGLVSFGIGTLAARKVPPLVGITLILLEPGSILTGLALSPIAPLHDRGAYSAGVEKGLALLFIGLGLRSCIRRLSPSTTH